MCERSGCKDKDLLRNFSFTAVLCIILVLVPLLFLKNSNLSYISNNKCLLNLYFEIINVIEVLKICTYTLNLTEKLTKHLYMLNTSVS